MIKFYPATLALISIGFSLFFFLTVIPPVLASGDVVGAIAAGFVNPYAAGYSTDVILCWLVLALWIGHESRSQPVKHAWVCLVLGVVPGVVVGFSGYLLLRHYQFTAE